MPPFRAALNPTGVGTAEHTYPAKFASVRAVIGAFTITGPNDIKRGGNGSQALLCGDEIRIYDDTTGEAIGGLRSDNGAIVWHPFQGKYATENLT